MSQPESSDAGNSDGGDVANHASATQWRLSDQVLFQIRTYDAATVCALGLNHTGIDGVDADLLRSELAGEHTGDGVQRALGAGVNRGIRRRQAANAGADVDDAAAFARCLTAACVVRIAPSTLMLNILWNSLR